VSRKDPRYDSGDNVRNPLLVLGVLDASRIGIAGNSMGALSTLNYLKFLGAGAGADGAPLPPVRAAISLSGGAPTDAVVPIQFQTSDYDGSPALVGPTVLGVNLGNPDPNTEPQGIGYHTIKQAYDDLRETDGSGALSLIVLEGGVHTDHVAVPMITRTLWANSLAVDYAADWFNCHIGNRPAACGGAISDRPHLSRAFASEQDPDGPAGAEDSLCIRIPDQASLNQTPEELIAALNGQPPYDCVP
jgi:hypothetical protein